MSDRLFVSLVSYSRCKTVEDIERALKLAPKQESNSEEAWKGNVFEVCILSGSPVGTLEEVYSAYKIDDIVIRVGDDEVWVYRHESGNWLLQGIVRGD